MSRRKAQKRVPEASAFIQGSEKWEDTFWQVGPWGGHRRLSMVLARPMLMHAVVMQQAPIAVVCKLLHEGGLVQGAVGAQHHLCLVCSKVQVRREDEEHEVDGCM